MLKRSWDLFACSTARFVASLVAVATLLGVAGVQIATPAPAEAAPCVSAIYRVTARDLALRTSAAGTPYTYLFQGEFVLKEQSAAGGTWMLVTSLETGQQGWVLSEYVAPFCF